MSVPESPFSSIPEALEELKAGRFIILVDDEDRENEGDLVCAAELVTPEMINFMIRQAAGKLCLSLTAETCERLHLYPQVSENTATHGTAFTVSIDAGPELGVTSGVSAADRCRTIRRCLDTDAKPSDFRRPGHISPLKSKTGGVLVRAGHTEASIDLAQLAGLKPAGVIIEILNSKGEIAHLDDLVAFARQHGFKICTIANLVEYRLQRERSIMRIESIPLENRFGRWMLHAYTSVLDSEPHVALAMGAIGALCRRIDRRRSAGPRPRSLAVSDRRRLRIAPLRLRIAVGTGDAADRRRRRRRHRLSSPGRPRDRPDQQASRLSAPG
jgi:3,4-dihydroxy 2-butanone 4-phosphate synthase/GTP cyclohydrolase II